MKSPPRDGPPLILDTNGNGKRDAYVEPNEDIDSERTKESPIGSIQWAPAADRSVWGSSLGYPGAVVRIVPGDNPSETALTGIL